MESIASSARIPRRSKSGLTAPGFSDITELLARLQAGRSNALTLVCAPAGYGKSTLASAWVEGLDRPHAWLSLDESDGELVAFLSLFVAALRAVDADVASDLLPSLHNPQGPAPAAAARTLANELDELEPLERLYIASNLANLGPAQDVAPRLKRAALRATDPDERRGLQCLLWYWY